MREKFGLSETASRILAARGHQADSRLEIYLSPSLKAGLPDPSGLKNLGEACGVIRDAAKSGKPIAICCDFDVDGLSGGAILSHFLRAAGAQVRTFVPDRFADGYGLNERIVRRAAKDGCGLIVAIDFGSTNLEELRLARKLGLQTIVIDHHQIGAEAPPADVLINPHQPGCGFADRALCAAGGSGRKGFWDNHL